MNRPAHSVIERLEPIEPTMLASEPLRHAATRETRVASAFRVATVDRDGSDLVELVAFKQTERFGIAWRGREWWLDASSPAEALQRWMEGDGGGGPQRPASSGA